MRKRRCSPSLPQLVEHERWRAGDFGIDSIRGVAEAGSLLSPPRFPLLMKGSLHFVPCLRSTMLAAALLAGGCKKHHPEVAAGSDKPDVVASGTSSATTTDEKATPRSGAAVGTAPTAPGGPAPELAATDVAYEAWFKKYHLDLNDPKMLDADPDGDGFTNREEFLADTNPLDPNSRPGVLGHLRLKDFNEVRVPFIVRAVDGETAKIEHTDGGDAKLETVKAGQTLKGTQYKVASLEAKQTQDKDGNPVDASKVVIEDEKTKQKIELVKDMPTRSAATYAILASLDGGTTLTVRQGDTFNWPNEKGATYRVIDLRGDQVVLEQVDNRKMWTVPRK